MIIKTLSGILFIFLIPCLQARAQQRAREITVAQDGNGNFTTIQSAIDAAPDFSGDTTTIFIKKGIYREKIIIPACKRLLRLIGENDDSTIIIFDNYAAKKNIFGDEMGTSGSASFYLFAPGFTAENITFQNSAGPVGQAVAIWIAGERARFIRCRFLGFQDTIYTFGKGNEADSPGGYDYFKDCYIEGTTDFIFGSATAVFDRCTIFCKKGGHYITAASTPDSARYGYVFLHCHITGDAPENSFYLGRPWRPYAKVVFINCELDKMINPAGWVNWHGTDNDKTAYYAEYGNTGQGAATGQRVPWSHQLTAEEVSLYTLREIFGDWNVNQ